MYQHILVPIDDSELAIDIASKAVAFAKALGARITFLHARPDYGATGNGALVRVMSPRDFADQADGTARAVLARAESEARDESVAFESIAKTSDRPYEAIIDTAEERGCDLIFMASHGRRGLKELLVGTQTQKVLAHTTIPVLVALVENSAQSTEMNKAINIIRGEHQSMAAVVHGLKHILRQARETGKPADIRLLRAMIHYFLAFRRVLHHPKEEGYLFARLRARAPKSEELVSRLEAQHHELGALLEALETAFNGYQTARDADHLNQLTQAVDRYSRLQWEHIKIEEKCIWPECRAYLTSEDWKEIANAFEQNGDPRFDKDREAGFDHLFSSIMNMYERSERGQGGHV
ncbi:UspA domain containing protein [Georgfuchsia toluolica]|uniref:UspA domain containing protein n=1 Tax=Georgfuchsia toluolica TaxID=424218 RepID=A0A916N9W0_9PROT|nr:universal stress protein [Georgfuchsia toluolica]CAG4885134.1 UspA domain containing protein [Georgfuchsia toluolica]